jgi:hypothetical protein
VGSIAEFVHKQKRSVQYRWSLIKDPGVAEAVLRQQITRAAGVQVLRLPLAERLSYLREAIAGRLTTEQVRADVDRRLAQPPSDDEPSAATSEGTGEAAAPSKADARLQRFVSAT